MPINRELVGSWIAERPYEVTTDAVERYVSATNDDLDRYARGDVLTAPPLFGIVGAWSAVESAISEVVTPDLYENVVHLVQDTHVRRPVVAGDTLLSKARLMGLSSNRAGTSLVANVVLRDAAGDEVGELYATIFVRGHSGEPALGETPPAIGGSRDGEPVGSGEQKVDADQAVRYADASGDHNPIHLDDAFATSVGLPGVILHGMCTLAFACRAAVDLVCGGDPARIRRFAGRFSRPVLPGHALTTTLWPSGDGAYVYQTTSPDGPAVKEGRVEIR